METLELKHLAPYLPYGLKGIIKNKTVLLQNLNKYSLETIPSIHGYTYCSFEHFKPILRPLSDLTKEIEIDGKKIVPRYTGILCKYEIIMNPDFSFFDGIGSNNEIDDMPYRVIQKLLEWHFDIFGLIEKGLAIDINTLKQ